MKEIIQDAPSDNRPKDSNMSSNIKDSLSHPISTAKHGLNNLMHMGGGQSMSLDMHARLEERISRDTEFADDDT